MSNPKGTLEEIESLLRREETECAWGRPPFDRSSYDYVSKQGMKSLQALLTRAKEEIDAQPNYQQDFQKSQKLLESAVAEINHLGDDNDQLRRNCRDGIVAIQGKDAWIAKVTGALTRLRGVFGGKASTHEQVVEILAEVDSVLKAGIQPEEGKP